MRNVGASYDDCNLLGMYLSKRTDGSVLLLLSFRKNLGRLANHGPLTSFFDAIAMNWVAPDHVVEGNVRHLL